VLQIPGDDQETEEHEHPPIEATGVAPASSATPDGAEPAGPYRTIALDVTGMT
jgi:hypothetical protein